MIISGGDPLAMATDRLVRLLRAVRDIPSVETIRLATRVPVTLPMRITGGAFEGAAAAASDLHHDPLQPPEGADPGVP